MKYIFIYYTFVYYYIIYNVIIIGPFSAVMFFVLSFFFFLFAFFFFSFFLLLLHYYSPFLIGFLGQNAQPWLRWDNIYVEDRTQTACEEETAE